MSRYRNRFTDEVVDDHDGSQAERLDSLSERWERLDDEPSEPDAPAEVAAKAAQAAAQAAEHAAAIAEQTSVEDPRGEIEAAAGDHQGPSTEHDTVGPERPGKSASRAAWAAYAVEVGHDDVEVAELTKAQIIELIDQPAQGS